MTTPSSGQPRDGAHAPVSPPLHVWAIAAAFLVAGAVAIGLYALFLGNPLDVIAKRPF